MDIVITLDLNFLSKQEWRLNTSQFWRNNYPNLPRRLMALSLNSKTEFKDEI
jgi:hypothetical protein